ncbi:MAG: GIY-YIG nuclease family protein [Cohaesibacteraceae bacterium]
MPFYVYMLASRPNVALYVGSTSNLAQRVSQHRVGSVSAHTKRYQIHALVWCEQHSERHLAAKREHQIKRWRRDWKIALIEENNPKWRDLSADLLS